MGQWADLSNYSGERFRRVRFLPQKGQQPRGVRQRRRLPERGRRHCLGPHHPRRAGGVHRHPAARRHRRPAVPRVHGRPDRPDLVLGLRRLRRPPALRSRGAQPARHRRGASGGAASPEHHGPVLVHLRRQHDFGRQPGHHFAHRVRARSFGPHFEGLGRRRGHRLCECHDRGRLQRAGLAGAAFHRQRRQRLPDRRRARQQAGHPVRHDGHPRRELGSLHAPGRRLRGHGTPLPLGIPLRLRCRHGHYCGQRVAAHPRRVSEIPLQQRCGPVDRLHRATPCRRGCLRPAPGGPHRRRGLRHFRRRDARRRERARGSIAGANVLSLEFGRIPFTMGAMAKIRSGEFSAPATECDRQRCSICCT